MEKVKEYTKEHFCFKSGPGEPVSVGTKGEFNSVAYSGGVITAHWYWDRLVIDLATMSVGKMPPILFEHSRGIIVGKATNVDKTEKLEISGKLFSDKASKKATEIKDLAEEGHEWEMSVFADPKIVEEVKAGTEVTVNGQTFQGPLVVFRETDLVEASFVLFGADVNTSVNVFKKAETLKPKNTNSGGTPEMDEKKFKELENKFTALAKTTETLTSGAETANKRADKAENELKEFKAGRRLEQVKAMFSKLGWKETEESIKTYIGMDEATFSSVSSDMVKNVKTLPEGFSTSILSDEEMAKFEAKENPLIANAKARAEV